MQSFLNPIFNHIFILQFQKAEVTPELDAAVARIAESRIWFEFSDPTHDKISRDKAIQAIREDVLSAVVSDFPNVAPQMIDAAYSQLTKRIFRFVTLFSPSLFEL